MTDTTLLGQIKGVASTLILLPTEPSYDEVASALSLYLLLEEKSALTVGCPSPMLVEFNRLVGVDRIVTELGNKNLVIKFVDYKASDIEKVSYDIENGEFKLSVVPKGGMIAPSEAQMHVSYSGVSAQAVILVGGDSTERFPALSEKSLSDAKLVHVGTRELVGGSGVGVVTLAKPFASISEVVGNLAKDEKLQPSADVATNLISGIEVGSDHFMAPEVTADTFQLVAELLRLGGVRMNDVLVAESFPAGSIPQGTPPSDWFGPKVYKGTSVS